MSISAKKIVQLNGNDGALYGLCRGVGMNSFFSCGSDKLVRQWNFKEGNLNNFALRFPITLYSVFCNPTQNLLLTGNSDGTTIIIDLHKKVVIKEIKLSNAPIFDIQFSSANKVFIIASGEGSVFFIDSITFEIKSSTKLCSEKVRGLDISADETELAIACGDGCIRIFDLSTQKEKLKFEAHQFSTNAVKFHPDGKHLISGGKDAYLNVWERNPEGGFVNLLSIPAHNFAIYSIAFHPEKKLFATASRDKTIKIWNAENFDFLLRISKENHDGHIHSVNKIYWSDYNNYLVSTGDDRAIIIWEIGDTHTSLRPSPREREC